MILGNIYSDLNSGRNSTFMRIKTFSMIASRYRRKDICEPLKCRIEFLENISRRALLYLTMYMDIYKKQHFESKYEHSYSQLFAFKRNHSKYALLNVKLKSNYILPSNK